MIPSPPLPFQDGKTPLHLAAKGWHSEVVKQLLQVGGARLNINARDKVRGGIVWQFFNVDSFCTGEINYYAVNFGCRYMYVSGLKYISI